VTVRADHHPDMATALQRMIDAAWQAYRFCPGSYGAEALRAAYAVAEAHERATAPDWIGAYLDYQTDGQCIG